jgi:hypothetical protein
MIQPREYSIGMRHETNNPPAEAQGQQSSVRVYIPKTLPTDCALDK